VSAVFAEPMGDEARLEVFILDQFEEPGEAHARVTFGLFASIWPNAVKPTPFSPGRVTTPGNPLETSMPPRTRRLHQDRQSIGVAERPMRPVCREMIGDHRSQESGPWPRSQHLCSGRSAPRSATQNDPSHRWSVCRSSGRPVTRRGWWPRPVCMTVTAGWP
jgi:hypothetical protein